MSVHHTLIGPDLTRWTMLRLEYAEYNSGDPLSIDLDCGSITDCEMDDRQPLMCKQYTQGEHESDDWASIDDEALIAESNYWFNRGVMIIR